MNLTIYRGTNQIGGNCIELEHNNTRILLDFGIPLEAMDMKNCKIEEFKPAIKNEYAAIFVSHAHPDHYGLLELIDNDTPIYATSDTCEMLKYIAPLTTKFYTQNLNFKVIDEKIKIGDFEIIAHPIDHSIAGACALEISCKNKTILYTGDIRFHGRCRGKNKSLTENIGKIDYLIMEGTTISRTNQEKVFENDLVKQFEEVFKKNKLPLVQVSAQNIDRFVTIFKACLSTKKTFVIDPYSCYILELYGKNKTTIPQFDWNNIRVYRANNSITRNLEANGLLEKYMTKEILIDEIQKYPQKFVIKGNFDINNICLKKFKKEKLNIIFSIWKGYLDKPSYLNNYKDIITCIHTSGHATVQDLQEFVETIKPKAIIPIHTECKEQYARLFNAPTISLNDNVTISL